ncbi:HisA/HisF-related TIM barrel protein [Planctomicrobium piriforme]|uniref:Phosphoribosylformimino-5-aminoimidazole carboxamide ribotide isomerase n=1 Tax=Planctomicrobium piriforme TaxID=1576369 RepID=A0A1I3E3U6_9PLAN|nr:HisA/HisF-related TIM barrel protein [Planctomicrobium piriforme]SFH93371.1 phosphoribosylformimino-5-aminoimidazole carboxamide ribotide isomerase [Planctomicrobium piriforme]
MDLVPVLDLKQGQVIRGIAGQREHYHANTSRLVKSADPVDTCQALKQAFRPHWMYIADLDAIENGEVQYAVLNSLVQCGVPLAVDAGVASIERAQRLIDLGVSKVIIGLETLPHLELLGKFTSALGPDRIIFSLDLRDGEPIGVAADGMHPNQVVSIGLDQGIRQLIVLELSRIGTSRGVPTGPLCHSIKNRRADLVVWTGGGVRQLADLHRLQLCRLDGVMVASSLHDGQITPADWQSFETLDVDETLLAMDA